MKQKLTLLLAVAIVFAACNNEKKNDDKTATVNETEKMDKSKETPMDSATMMKNWQEYMTPGPMHQMMASWAGTWDGDITMWMDPSKPPTKMTGVATYKPVLNGLYLESTHTGDMGGMPFEGHGVMAYDNAKKKFISTWYDNMGSGFMTMEGPWDEATKTMTLTGRAYEPMKGKECDFRQVSKMVDDNTMTMEMYGPGPDGKETKMMEIKSTRKKS
jgi:hypothetical protein